MSALHAYRSLEADLHSESDEIAARVVATGGGMQAVVAATGYRTLDAFHRPIIPRAQREPASLGRIETGRASPPGVPLRLVDPQRKAR